MNPLNPPASDTHDPVAELREELGRVAVSPDFAKLVRERLSDDLEPLRAELADINVSPEFAVRVRQGIDVEAERRPLWGFNWRWAVPAAGLAAAAMVVLWPLTTSELPEPTRKTVTHWLPSVQPPVAPPVVSSSTSRVGPAAAQPVEAGSLDPAAVTARPAFVAQRVEAGPAGTKPAARDPFLEVITDQPELLRTLWVRVESGVAVDSTEPAGIYSAPKLEVPRVEVGPVSLFVVPNLRAPVGVSPFILRIAADSAARSSK